MSRRHRGLRAVGRTVAGVPLVVGLGLLLPAHAAAHAGTTIPPFRTVAGDVLRPNPARWVLPTEGYHLTGRFGDVSGLWHTVHTGLDFAAPYGTPIRAVSGGVIVSTAYDGSYGNKTVERLPDGTDLWYAHQSAFAVQPGTQVVPGQLIGYIGTTGNTTGPHVHLEVRPDGGAPIDPFTALEAHGLHP
ncbi:M23 family metallopeptidase [Nocardioides terrisoli]|uniref:M23 family metallopeptidase n=1 Tax=Nocardioides terrisoli TaxID=3388267 RepID=UPI00287B90F7|nr:M23 family metallopeptidase [Nocardioides marmorisolisilvae]